MTILTFASSHPCVYTPPPFPEMMGRFSVATLWMDKQMCEKACQTDTVPEIKYFPTT